MEITKDNVEGRIYDYLDDFSHYDTEDSDGYTYDEFIDMVADEYNPRVGVPFRSVFHVAVGTDSDGYTVPEFLVLAKNEDSSMETAVEFYESHYWDHKPEDYETEDEYWDVRPEFSVLQIIKTWSINEWIDEFAPDAKNKEEDEGTMDENKEKLHEARVATKMKAIQLLRKTARDQVEFTATHWPDDRDMIRVARQDAKKLNEAADLIKDNNFEAAYNKLEQLDTAVREEVPIEVFNFLKRATKSVAMSEQKEKDIKAGQIESLECDGKCKDGTVTPVGHTEATCEKEETVKEQKIDDTKLKGIEKDLSGIENKQKNAKRLSVESKEEKFETGVMEIKKLKEILSKIKNKIESDYEKNPTKNGAAFSGKIAVCNKHIARLNAISEYLDLMSAELAYGTKKE